MNFLNETIDKAKDLFSVAKQKTEEAVNVGKQKYDIVALESKTQKLYSKLGKMAYPLLMNQENLSPEIKNLVLEIKQNKELIVRQKNELGKMQHKRECASCGATVSENAKFCDNCGEKLIFEE